MKTRSEVLRDKETMVDDGELDPGFLRIVGAVVIDDPWSTYKQLEEQLVIGDKRGDYGTVAKRLDEAETNARLAHKLWQSAIVERKRWEYDRQVVFSAMRTEANRSLQEEKDKGQRNKAITDADVEARIATLYPDDYRTQELKRERVKAMVASMENLCELWMSRCRTLNTMLGKQR